MVAIVSKWSTINYVDKACSVFSETCVCLMIVCVCMCTYYGMLQVAK